MDNRRYIIYGYTNTCKTALIYSNAKKNDF